MMDRLLTADDLKEMVNDVIKKTRKATLEEVKGIIQKHITYYKAEYTKHDNIALELSELFEAIEGLE
jgi:hypothetical protein